MKRWIPVVFILVLAAALLPAQAFDFAEFETSFQDFADAVAGNLASTATSGLAWSPAHIGQFPHLGLGLTVGGTMMPYEVVQPVLGLWFPTLPPELAFLETYGVPLPAAAIDARIGGFLLPFDIGLKIGFIPDQVKAMMGDVQADYFIAGGDFRFAILQDKGFSPALSIGVGYSYLKGGVQVPDIASGTTLNIADIMTTFGGKPFGPTYELVFTDPDLDLTWESHVIEAKAQLSKNLLIFTPHVGVGAAYAMTSSVGGGMVSDVEYYEDGSPGVWQDVIDAFNAAGKTPPTAQGITVAAEAPAGWAFRVFGGTSVNILFLRLDLDVNWNVLTNAYGGNLNLRFQL
jgi:hypothetical protein